MIHRPQQTSPLPARRGVTVVEMVIATILLGTAVTVAMPTLAWLARHRRAVERQQEALVEVGNLLERVTALPYDEITPERMEQLELPERLRRQLPEAEWTLDLHTEPREPEAKRITVELRWKTGADRRSAPVRLTAWVYRDGRAGP